MKRRFYGVIAALLLVFGGSLQFSLAEGSEGYLTPILAPSALPPAFNAALNARTTLPVMSPDLALKVYAEGARQQVVQLGAYSDETVIEADLPDAAKHGRFELRRTYAAPRTLAYKAERFVGDGFVKNNVITRLLQSEVEHVQKGDGAQTAINVQNYKFAFKKADLIGDDIVYVYEVRPTQRRVGLFRGTVSVDARTGHLRRVEGQLVKSPSWWVKKIDFVQDYQDFGAFSLPTRLHSVSNTRIVGRAVVDILHADYQAHSVAELRQHQPNDAETATYIAAPLDEF